MAPKSTLAGLLALTTLSTAAPNQNRLVEVETDELVLPPTESGDNLWAKVVSESDDTTEYLVACEDAFSHPEDCKGPYKGVTVTQSSNSMSLKLDGTSYDCVWTGDGDDEMECVIGNDQEIISGDDLDEWIAEVTIVEPANNLELRDDDPEVSKRKSGSSSGGGGRGGSSSKSSKGSSKSSKKKGSSGPKLGKGGSGNKNNTDENGVGPTGSNSLPSTFAVAVAALGFALAL